MQEYPLQLIIEQKKVNDILRSNPFLLNQLLNCGLLNDEEIMIRDILEIYDALDDNDDINIIKSLLSKKYDTRTFRKFVLFIIRDVYQEIVEDSSEKNNIIRYAVETKEINIDDLVDEFIRNDEFSNDCLEYFLIYNLNIQKGHLEELKEKPSYEFVKKRFSGENYGN